ncbi:MAG: 4Fe-4S binding protein [Bacillota bacterium]|jgi:MinD superfamily P-loop ATPase
MRQLLILSGKGGTGKTTITSAFVKLAGARAFADCDVDAPNLHLVLKMQGEPQRDDYYGLDKAEIDGKSCTACGLCQEHCRFGAIEACGEVYTVNYYACEGCGVCEAICPRGAVSLKPAVAGELKLYREETVFSTAQLTMGSGNSGMLVSEVKGRMKEAAGDVELAIIDGSPGIGCPVIASLSGVDMVLIVAEPSLSGISDMERILKTAGQFQTKAAVCVNKYDINRENTRRIEEYCAHRSLPYLGAIPFDSSVVEAVNQGKSIVDVDCPAGRAVRAVFIKTMEVLKGSRS